VETTEAVSFVIAFLGYWVSLFVYVLYALTKTERFSRAAHGVLVGAVAAHAFHFAVRIAAAQRAPLTGMYVPWSNWFESLSFFALLIAAFFLIVQARVPLPILGVFALPWTCLAVTAAVLRPLAAGPDALRALLAIPQLDPRFQSVWMMVHVPAMFASYAAFANAFGMGLAYLVQERQIKSKKPTGLSYRLPPLEDLDRLIFKTIAWTFPLLTVGLIMGAFWAHAVWHTWWVWDAKVLWSVLTWLIYSIYLGLRLLSGWSGRRTAYLSMAGFALVLFTYVGVNYLSRHHGFLTHNERTASLRPLP